MLKQGKYLIILVIVGSLSIIVFLNYLDNSNPTEKGDTRSFWFSDYSKNEYYESEATLLAEGNWCYLYMAVNCITRLGEDLSINKCIEICNEFDSVIYPRIIDLAGSPNGTKGDIDADPKIYIMFTDGQDSYYSEVNDRDTSYSNYCEMIYISHRLFNNEWLYPIIAHEFHHLIWFNNDGISEPPFTLEALAQYAMYHAGYLGPHQNLASEVTTYLSYPNDSPLYWNQQQMQRDYGSAYLFAFYVAEKYGIQILRDLIYEPANGAKGIENVLQKAGYDISFNELYLNWITAITINKIGFQNNLYGFTGLHVRIMNVDRIFNLPIINKTTSVSHYGFRVHNVDKLESLINNVTVTLTKPSNRAVGLSLAVHNTTGWHVYQTLFYNVAQTIKLVITDSSIEEIFVIYTYTSHSTPNVPKDITDTFPSINMNLTILEGV